LRRTILVAVPLALLALAGPAAAHGKQHATTYKAAVSGESGVRGQAKLVDGKRRDKVRLRVKGLAAGESYTWSIRAASADGDACAGETVAEFSYAGLTARRHGRDDAGSRSRTFAAEDGTSYAVVVTAADGTDVACGELATKAQRKAERKKARGHDGNQATGADEQGDDQQGHDDQQADEPDDDATDDSSADDSAGDDTGVDD
jgi:hypothetical protein